MKFKVKLTEEKIKYLLSKPEKGMGYQIVDIKLIDGRIISDVTVLNGEELELDEYIEPSKILEIIVR